MKTTLATFVRAHWLLVAAISGVLWLVGLRVYYCLKPWLPLAIKLAMRRRFARRVRARSSAVWPILETAGDAPAWFKGWPGKRRFTFVITHDVELQKGLDRVKQLAEVEMAYGFRSSFNFIPEGPYRVDAELRAWLEERGFEVGVHDHRHDGKLYASRSNFIEGAARINHHLKEWKATGFRSGFMFHNLEWLEDLDVAYDASTFDTDPFEPQPDAAKTIFPFWHQGKNGRGYMEMPYTLVQDSTLFVMLQEKNTDIWKRKLEWIALRNGMALLNTHPDYMAFNGEKPNLDEFPIEHYAEFLNWVRNTHGNECWNALPREVAAYCRTQIEALDPKPSKTQNKLSGLMLV